MKIKSVFLTFTKWLSIVDVIPAPDNTVFGDGVDQIANRFFRRERWQFRAMIPAMMIFVLGCMGIGFGLLMAVLGKIPADELFLKIIGYYASLLVTSGIWICFFTKLCHDSMARDITDSQYEWCLKSCQRLGMDEPRKDMNKKALAAYVRSSQQHIKDMIANAQEEQIRQHVDGL